MFAFSTGLLSFALQKVMPVIQANFGTNTIQSYFFTSIISAGGTYSLIYFVPLWMYETFGWRIRNPNLDFSGTWELIIEFDAVERPISEEHNLLPPSYRSFVTIKQTIYSAKMIQGHAPQGEVWKSSSLDVSDDGEMLMAYEVTRSVASQYNLPLHSIGVDKTTVQDHTKFGRPCLMLSHWYHCALPNTALYRGHCTYRRLTRKEKKELLTEFGRRK